ncbi:MAG: diguanylate cyclase [Porticoccus sp.]|nr:diguanylate cyclase [Porticoccus sp.]MBQ0806354.1 diguanylate cyclase [Porticoccus sp.]
MTTLARAESRTPSKKAIDAKHVLIVESSSLIIQILEHFVGEHLSNYVVHFAKSFSEGCSLYEQHKDQIFAGLVNLNLPDAPDGEMVDHLLARDVPLIVLTGNYNDKKREQLLEQGVIDYVIKESRYSYEYALKLIKRLEMNQKVKILVAEDSLAQKDYIEALLKQHMYQVVTVDNGVEALAAIKQNPDISLLITDYDMPEMDGFSLTKALRREYTKAELIIIGLSAVENNTLSARFIKNGANDFLCKPFIQEELHCRITHNIEAQEHLNQIKEWAFRDPLTNLFNRRYLFGKGVEFHRAAKNEDGQLSIAIVDIDYFKKINDKYGHDAGDKVLIEVADILIEQIAPHSVVRMGGEEFCIVMQGLDNSEASALVDSARQKIESTPMGLQAPISVRVSAGVATVLGDTLDQQINAADALLYRAKENGRNQVVHE